MLRAQSRILAHAHARQIETATSADRLADQADAVVRRHWLGWLRWLKTARWGNGDWRGIGHLSALFQGLVATLQQSLKRQARRSYRSASATYARVLPVRSLQFAATRRPFLENADPSTDTLDFRQQLADLIFPPPPEEWVRNIVFSGDWVQRLQATPSARPEAIASRIADGLAAGKTHVQIARDVRPLVDGIRSRARTIARTESMRVAHAGQMQCHAQLGDLVIGYQVRATLDQHTRPAHAARNGTIYYRDPVAGQLGYEKMPHPPQEADGSTAWGCRCYLVPVLRPPEQIASDPARLAVFTTAQKDVVPDPVEYGQWFAGASEKERRLAVGSKRYSLIADAVGEPRWEHFLSPATGDLVPVKMLAQEGPHERAQRTYQAAALVQRRAELLRRVNVLGSDVFTG